MTKLALRYVHAFRDRHGRMRHYFRRRREKAVPLPGLPGSEEFMSAYQEALATEPPPKPEPVSIGATRAQPGTIEALTIAYYRSTAWTSLSPSTQKARHSHIEGFRYWNGSKRVATLTSAAITSMLAQIPNVYARRDWFAAIRGLLHSGVPAVIKTDPTVGIAPPKVPRSKPHHRWTDEEIEKYRAYWKLGTQQRLVLEFALEAVSRRAEVVRLGPQHVKHGKIRIERVHGSADVEIPLTPDLAAAIDAMPRQHLTFIVTQNGRPRSPKGLGNDFREWATDAGLPARCRLHGLKRSGMTRMAESGATTHELMAISGHKTLSMVDHYTQEANRKRLAESGIRKVKRRTKRVANLRNQKPTNP